MGRIINKDEIKYKYRLTTSSIEDLRQNQDYEEDAQVVAVVQQLNQSLTQMVTAMQELNRQLQQYTLNIAQQLQNFNRMLMTQRSMINGIEHNMENIESHLDRIHSLDENLWEQVREMQNGTQQWVGQEGNEMEDTYNEQNLQNGKGKVIELQSESFLSKSYQYCSQKIISFVDLVALSSG